MNMKNKQENLAVIPELTISNELLAKVNDMVESTENVISEYWADEMTEEIFVPIDVGEIRVLHVKPKKPKNKIKLVFIPGWGTIHTEFNDLYEAFNEEIEFYYVETREKSTSKIKRRKTKLTLSEKAKDIKKVIDYFKLTSKEYILVGPCWGASVIVVGLFEKTLEPVTAVLFDPAYKLAFSRFLVNLSIFVPTFFITLLKKFFKFFVLLGMKEKRQRERNSKFIDNAIIWKWKRSAIQNRKLNLFEILPKIDEEILIFNGSKDKFHPQEAYPEVAKALPKGRFFFLKVDEGKRERMLGAVLREFALGENKTDIPPALLQFEKKLNRVR